MIKDSNRLHQLLKKVNRQINNIPYKRDASNYDVPDYWTAEMESKGSGDCDDYMLAKRKALLDAGLDWRFIYPATCELPGYGAHAVLIVRTDRNAYVLCNNTDRVEDIAVFEAGRSMRLKPVWYDYYDPVDRKWYDLKEPK